MSPAPVILDIVGSRRSPDRAALQAEIHAAAEEVAEAIPPLEGLWATVGDEFQVVYRTLAEALRATALMRLIGGGRFDCRYGIGVGDVRTIDRGPRGPIEEGPGWERARRALEEVTRMQAHGSPWLRAWAVLDDGAPGLAAQVTAAYLTSREHIISRLKAREARIAAAWLAGATQTEIARAEKISQTAVSQRLQASGGAALAQAERVLLGGRP